MTIIISDTSVLCYLAWVGKISLIESLFGRILIPRSVFLECAHIGAPQALRDLFFPQIPSFIEIADVEAVLAETVCLDLGEAEAISLAWQHRENCILLIDEKRGRAIAHRLGIRLRGLLGIVVEGHRRGLLDFDSTMNLLRGKGFRVSEELLAMARSNLKTVGGDSA